MVVRLVPSRWARVSSGRLRRRWSTVATTRSGKGKSGWPAGAGLVPGVAGGMAARPLLALGLPQGGELGDQLVQFAGGHPGQLGECRGAVSWSLLAGGPAVCPAAGWRV